MRGVGFTPTASLPVPPNPANNYIVPKGRSSEEVEQARRDRKSRSAKSSAITLPRDYRQKLQFFKPSVSSGYALQGHAEQPHEHIQKKVQSLAAYQRYKLSMDHPDEIYHFTRAIKTIAASLQKQQNIAPLEVLRNRLATISIDTDAFIAVPDSSEHTCNIWGERDQIIRAKESLHAFELSAAAPTKGQNTTWDKINAYDGRAESRLMRETWMTHQRQYFQQETDDSAMPYQFHLFWPDGYDLDNFIQDYNESVLQDLMNKYNCIIRQQTTHRITKIACDSQQDLFQVYNRLLGLVKEMVARKQPGLCATHCEVPDPLTYRDQVKLREFHVGREPVYLPVLTGNRLSRTEHENWTKLSSLVNKRYRLATKNALRSCISAMHMSRRHLQLRVNFGDPGLTQFMKSEKGQGVYDIDDFLFKVERPGTKILMCPLQEGPSFNLIDKIDSCNEFSAQEISWEVAFDFSGGPNKKLQLLKEYVPNVVDPNEPSVAASRWLVRSDASIEDNPDLLVVNHIDMQRVGYQLYLGGGVLFQNQKTLQDLRTFGNHTKFRPSPNGLRYKPGKHVIHPYGNQELTSVRETAIAKYRFKDTRGTFEIRRTEIFNSKPGEVSPIPYRTEWSAAYYYAGWDNLLAEFANIEPGQDVAWKRDLKTFFPQHEEYHNPQILPLGFKAFMKEVDAIQTLIARVLGRNQDDGVNQANGFVTGEPSRRRR